MIEFVRKNISFVTWRKPVSHQIPTGLVILFITIFLSGCSEPKEYQPIVKSVITVEPRQPNATSERALSGILQPADQSVLSFEIPGVIKTVEVNLGDKFERGDVLASIDDKVLRLAVQQRKGQLSETQARLTEASIDYQRKLQLLSSGAVSKAEVDLAKSRFDSLSDQVEIAKTQVALAEEDLADTQLIAPFSGSVAQRHVEPSQQVSRSTEVLTLQGSDALEVSVFVPESMISQINSNDSVFVDVLVDQRKHRLSGRIFEIGKQAQRANAFPVTVSLISGDKIDALQPGMSAEVSFVVASFDLAPGNLQAPLSSVAADADNQHFIFLVKLAEGNTYQIQKLAVEVVSMDANHVVFNTNQEVGEIVRNGLEFLRDGQKVFKYAGTPRMVNE